MTAVLDRIIETATRAYPASSGLEGWETTSGHRDEWGPAGYGDYLATSNDIYSVVSFRARALSRLPLLPYLGRDAEKRQITAGPEVDLLRHVNPHWTWPRLLRMYELSMGVWGESPWAVQRDARGVPREIWWLKAPRLHPIPHPVDYLAGYLYEPAVGPDIRFSPSEIIWHRYPNPLDEYAGLPPLVAARLAADVASASMKSNRALFTQGMQIGGIVSPAKDKVSYTAAQAAELEEMLERRFKGADKAHRWGVLRFEADVRSLAVTPKDAEFVAGLNLTFRQVCRVYGVPSPLLFDLEHATLANLRELQRTYWEHAGVPDADFLAAELEEQLLPMFGPGRLVDHLAWDYSTVPALQEALTSVWDRERQQIDAGSITINEWRLSHGRPPLPWGDAWWAPLNKAPVTDASGPPAATGEDDRSLVVPALRFARLPAGGGPPHEGDNGYGHI